MTRQEILTKAITQAIAGGWKFKRIDMLDVPKELAAWACDPLEPRYPTLIYQHQFAKALWGEKKHQRLTAMMPWSKDAIGSPFFIELSLWQYHLQQMVIAEDPIKYLSENI